MAEKSTTWLQYFAAFAAALCVFLVGTCWGWSSPAKIILFGDNPPFNISKEDFALATSLTQGGAVPGPLFGTLFINILGRKTVLILTTIPFTVSWMLIYFAKNATWLIISRFLSGLAAGTAMTLVPIYIGEIASPEVRGLLANLTMLFMKGGTLFSYAIGPYVSFSTDALIIAIGSSILFIILFWIPESPYYYLWVDDEKRTLTTLQKLRSTKDLSKDLEIIKAKIVIQKTVNFLDCLKDPVNQKSLFLLIGAFTCQHICGITALIAYTADIFKEIDDSVASAQTNNIIFGAVGLVGIFISGILVDKLGRRILFIISSVSTAVALSVLATYLMLKHQNVEVSNFSMIPTIALLAIPVTYGIGLGPIPFIYTGELIAPNFKTFAACIATMITCGMGACVVMFFPSMSEKYGTSMVLYFYTFLTVLGAIFVVVFLPETKCQTLEQIQDNFRSKIRPQNNAI